MCLLVLLLVLPSRKRSHLPYNRKTTFESMIFPTSHGFGICFLVSWRVCMLFCISPVLNDLTVGVFGTVGTRSAQIPTTWSIHLSKRWKAGDVDVIIWPGALGVVPIAVAKKGYLLLRFFNTTCLLGQIGFITTWLVHGFDSFIQTKVVVKGIIWYNCLKTSIICVGFARTKKVINWQFQMKVTL